MRYKIGYTTGVFDLFHIGHLRIIQRAKERCQHLIVGVSTDEIVESYKKSKPIIPFEERFEIIGALNCVDQVVAQDNFDKIHAWEKYKFDVHFHGNDWENSKEYNKIQKEFKKRGVDNVFFPYTKGTSTSALKKHIYEVLNKQ